MMDQPWEIPQVWKWVEIKALGEIVSGGTPSTKETSYWGNDINWISPADLTGYTEKTICRGAKSLSHEGLAKSSAKLMPAGSIHFSSRAPIGYVAISSQPLSTNQGFKSIVPAQGIYNEYVYYYLKAAKNIAEERASGTTFREISGSAFGKLPFPLSALPEQNEIVAKIEELFSELDNGIESLKKAREQLKTYRQAVLKYAFEGKLTQEWREQQIQAGNLPEPAEKLLERIKEEREAHYQQQVEEWKKACEQAKKDGSKNPAKPRKPKDLPPLTEKELAELPELPEGWGWCYPESVCSTDNYSIGIGPFGSNLKVADYKSEGIPLIFVKHITNENFSINQKYVSKEKFQELIPHSVKPLDILITKMGDPPGDCTIYPENNSIAILTADCLKFRVWEKFADRRYVMNCLKNVYVKKQLGLITKGVAQKKISTERFKTLKLPITNLNEQQAIVSEIETRLSVCDQLEKTIEDSLKKAEALRQSILKKAFEGELTREWRAEHPELISGENSAESLLARIREEKAQLKGIKR